MGGYLSAGKRIRRSAVSVLFIVLCIAAFFIVWLCLGSTGEAADVQGMEILEKSLQQAVTVCYSIEGIYPPTIDYICDNYGVVIDDTRYAVFYNIFADNIMPEIAVIPLY